MLHMATNIGETGRREWIGIGLICVLTVVVYGQSLTYGFNGYDDGTVLVDNPAVQALSWRTLRTIFTSFDPELYVPLTMFSLQVEHALGLAPGGFAQVLHTLCEDLLMGAYAGGSMMCSVDEATLASLLAEVDEPALQAQVLRLAGAAAEADTHPADAEAMVVAAACRQWHIGNAGQPARAEVQVLQPA